jgi:hypothetical protein
MRTGATFRVFGEGDLTAAAVTSRLGLVPTEEWEAGSQRGPRSPVRPGSGWFLKTELLDDAELSQQLEDLLDRLEPVAPELWELVEAGYQANWFCYVGSHASEHAMELDRELLSRLLRLPGDLWLDIYEDS